MKFTLKDIFAREKGLVERRSTARSDNGNNATILIVDDSKTVLFTIDKFLQSAGFKTMTATNARDGIELAKTFRPDLILMDVVMPEINGFQATRIIRKTEETRDIPIIIISGNRMQTEQLWGQRLGANGFLPKPVERAAFFELANKLLKTKQQVSG